MRSNSRPRINLQHKLILAHAAVTLAAILIAEVIALRAVASIEPQPIGSLHFALVAIVGALVGLLLGAWASRRLAHRQGAHSKSAALGCAAISRCASQTRRPMTWACLASQLDLLAEHLEKDEQDLDELRERNTRLTDQVRALAVVEERNRLARELHDSVKQHLFEPGDDGQCRPRPLRHAAGRAGRRVGRPTVRLGRDGA